MTRIDCAAAGAGGIKPGRYIGGFVERLGKKVLLATDEEWNDLVRLDVESAVYLGRLLLKMAGDSRRG